MVKTISEQELESYLWQAANILRGVIDASEYKSIIFPLMFFKRISDAYDEEYEEALKESKGDTEYASYPEQHEFQVPKGCHWRDIRQVTKDVGRAIKTAMENIEKANNHLKLEQLELRVKQMLSWATKLFSSRHPA